MTYRKRGTAIDLEYLLNNTTKNNLTGCMEWNKAISIVGYGIVRINHKNFQVHRLVYSLVHGNIKENELVCHKCDNRKCCNPDHLFLGTHKDNTQDMLQKHRENRNSKNVGMSHGKSILTDADILEIRKAHENGDSLVSISNRYGVSSVHIGRIVNGKRWTHIKI